MSSKKKTIWIGIIPEIFGYGMAVVGNSQEECFETLKKDYEESSKDSSDDYEDAWDENGRELTRFEKAMEYWSGSIEEVELCKVYFDNFR